MPEDLAIERVDWSPDGRALLAETRDAAYVWQNDNLDGPGFGVEAGDDATIGASDWQSDGRTFACGTSTGDLILLTIAGPADIAERRFRVSPTATGISSLKWSSDRKTLLVGRENGAVQLVDVTAASPYLDSSVSGEAQDVEGVVPETVVAGGDGVEASVGDISPDNSLIAVAGNSTDEPGIRLIVNRVNGKPMRDDVEERLLTVADGCHSRPITALQFSSDGQYLLSASEDGTVKRWKFNTRLSSR